MKKHTDPIFDLEVAWRKLIAFFKLGDNNKNNQVAIPQAEPKSLAHRGMSYSLRTVSFILIAFLLAGIVDVPEGGANILTKNGEYAGQLSPGVHWASPSLRRHQISVSPVTLKINITKPDNAINATQGVYLKDSVPLVAAITLKFKAKDDPDYLKKHWRDTISSRMSKLKDVVAGLLYDRLSFTASQLSSSDLISLDHKKTQQDLKLAMQQIIDQTGLGISVTDLAIVKLEPAAYPALSQMNTVDVSKLKEVESEDVLKQFNAWLPLYQQNPTLVEEQFKAALLKKVFTKRVNVVFDKCSNKQLICAINFPREASNSVTSKDGENRPNSLNVGAPVPSSLRARDNEREREER